MPVPLKIANSNFNMIFPSQKFENTTDFESNNNL